MSLRFNLKRGRLFENCATLFLDNMHLYRSKGCIELSAFFSLHLFSLVSPSHSSSFVGKACREARDYEDE